MTRTHWWIILSATGVCLLLLKLGSTTIAADPERRNLEIFREMVDSQAAESFAASTVFADGSVIRRPVDGTVPRGHLPLRYPATAEGAQLAGEELVNPFAAVPGEGMERERAAWIERGRVVYQTYCTPCHGPSGRGDGPVTSRGVPPPPPLQTEAIRGMSDGQLLHIITFGQGNMAAYASQIDREDRWKTILYLRTLSEEPAR